MIKKWLDHIKTRIQGKNKSAPDLNQESIHRLMRGLQHTKDKELDCEETFRMLDEYVELTIQGENTKELFPLVYHHLEMCRDCREEYEVLLEILSNLHQE